MVYLPILGAFYEYVMPHAFGGPIDIPNTSCQPKLALTFIFATLVQTNHFAAVVAKSRYC